MSWLGHWTRIIAYSIKTGSCTECSGHIPEGESEPGLYDDKDSDDFFTEDMLYDPLPPTYA